MSALESTSFCSSLFLHCRMPCWSAAQQRRGFRTQRWRTPALILSMSLLSGCPNICPVWFQYNFPNGRTRWSETPWLCNATLGVGQVKQKSVHVSSHKKNTGSETLISTTQTLNKSSPTPLPGRNPCCPLSECSCGLSSIQCSTRNTT